MLINFTDLITRHRIKPKGIIHAGGHYAEEFAEYQKNGITQQLWIEALQDAYKVLVNNIKSNPTAVAVNACISDTDGATVEFGYTPINNGESSSFLEFGTHKQIHPEVEMTEKIKMNTTKIDTIFSLNKLIISPDNYDMINADLQGCELMALKGATETLNHIKYLYLEFNETEVYKGCALLPELTEFLIQHGFQIVEKKYGVAGHWGDLFAIKK